MSIGAGHIQASTFDIKEYTHKHGLPNLVWRGAALFPTEIYHGPECFHPDDIAELHAYYAELRDHSELHEEVYLAEDCQLYVLAVDKLIDEHKWASMEERPAIKARVRKVMEQERLAAGVQWSEEELKSFAKELRSIYDNGTH